MIDDLERLIQATDGQPPSDDFVARLRAQIVAETEGPGVEGGHTPEAALDEHLERTYQDGNDFAIVLDVVPLPADSDAPPDRRALGWRRTPLLVGAALAVAAFFGVWALTSTGEDDGRVLLDSIDDPTTLRESDDVVEGGQLLTAGNTFFGAGSFRIDTLGTVFNFSVDETMGLLLNDNGVVSMSDLTSTGIDDRTITLRRTPWLPNPSDPTARVGPTGGWPVTDLRGWIDAVGGEVTVGEPVETTLGGLGATLIALEVGDLSCNIADCASRTPEELPDTPMLSFGSAYRLWVIDQGDRDAIVVTIAIDDPDEMSWFDEADAILTTLQFESVRPSPVRQVDAGSAELGVFGGVTLLAPGQAVIVEPFEGFARILPGGIGGDVEFLAAPLDTDGVELTTTDHLLELLADEAIELTDLDSVNIGGLEARVVHVSSGPFPNVVLNTRTADLVRPEFGWEPPRIGHLWAIEHPDRGLLLVSAEASAGPDAAEPLRSWATDMLRSLEFREP